VTNQAGGTVTIGAASTRQDDDTLTSNAGSFTVASGADLALSDASSFTNTGSLTVTGTLSTSGGTFTQSGGSETGNPVTITGGTLADSAGTGAFAVLGGTTLTGTIPAGQTVTVSGATTNVELLLPSAVTDDGVLALAPTSSGNAYFSGAGPLTVASGGVLSTIAGGSGSQPAYIYTPVTNKAGGTITIGAASTLQDDDSVTSNAGIFQVSNGGQFALSDSSTLSDTASGTIGVTVNGTPGTGGISGPGG
jgi:hypothetical protein